MNDNILYQVAIGLIIVLALSGLTIFIICLLKLLKLLEVAYRFIIRCEQELLPVIKEQTNLVKHVEVRLGEVKKIIEALRSFLGILEAVFKPTSDKFNKLMDAVKSLWQPHPRGD